MTRRSVWVLIGLVYVFGLAAGTTAHACPAFSYCTAYSAGAVVTYNGSNYTAAYAIPANRDCSAYTPATDNWWGSGGSCSTTGPTATPTATSGGCVPSAITPYVQVNGGSWLQTSDASAAVGNTVAFGPQPVNGGSWSWSGPNGYRSTSRQVTISNAQVSESGQYVATHANSGGCTSSATFTLTVSASASWVTVLNGSEFSSASSLWANFNDAYPWGSDHNGSARMMQSNVAVSNGALVLTSQKITDNEGNSSQSPFLPIHYHSGTVYWNQQVVVSDATTQWTLEGDFAVPSVTGTWPAFWLTAVSGWPPELDVMEYKGHATCWQNTFNGIYPSETVVSHESGVSDPAAFHHYKIWLGQKNSTDILVDYYIDGAWKAEDTAANYIGKPMWLIMDLQMEGASGDPGPTANQSYYAKNLVVQKYE